MTAQQYATNFMTLDCNGLVGNFYGGNPSGNVDTDYSKRINDTEAALINAVTHVIRDERAMPSLYEDLHL